MMIRIFNARILTKEHGLMDSGEVWIEDGKITFLSEVSPLILKPWDREIDLQGNLLMPSFKNAHAHSPMTFLRSYADDLPLDRWLFETVFPNEAKLQNDDFYWLSRLAILEYLSSGMSVVSDMYFNLKTIGDAFVDSGMRNVILEGITTGNGPRDVLYKRLDDGKAYLDKRAGLIEYRLGIHAEYTNSKESLQDLADYANANKMPVYVHMSETKKEVKECIGRYGITPVKLFEEMGLWNYGGTIYHGVHTNEEDRDIIKKRNISVVSNPASNLKLASGIAPLVDYVNRGINVGLGTDGPASNNSLDMFREMYLATTLQKYLCEDASALDANIVLDMATTNGAKAMGLEGLDGIYVGAKADVIAVDLHQPNMQPINNIEKNLVYAGNKGNVYLTIVNGEIKYEKGNYYVGEDVDRIYSQANKIAKRIKNS